MARRFGVAALGRSTFDVAYAEETAARAFNALEASGHAFVGPREVLFDSESAREAFGQFTADLDGLLVLQVTFADAGMVTELAERSSAPLLLWAFPEPRSGGRLRLNSLCGINLAAHALSREGRAIRYLYARPDANDLPERLARGLAGLCNGAPLPPEPAQPPLPKVTQAAQKADSVLAMLYGRSIGVIGQHPDGFATCRYDARQLHDLLGLEIAEISLDELFALADRIEAPKIEAGYADLQTRITDLASVDRPATLGSLRVFEALKTLVRRRGLSGIAVRCWPEFFTARGCAACAPMSMVADLGVPASCEADVLGTVTSLIVQNIAGHPPFLADLVHLDASDDTAVLWHCGCAPEQLAGGPVGADVHSNRKRPLLFAFPLKPGRVTLARLSQAGGTPQLILGGGEVLDRPRAFSGTSGVVRLDDAAEHVADRLIGWGVEHHLALAYGEHRPVLIELAERLRLPVRHLC